MAVVFKVEVTVRKLNNIWRARYQTTDTYYDDVNPYEAVRLLCMKVSRFLDKQVESSKVIWLDPEPKVKPKDWHTTEVGELICLKRADKGGATAK
jgi:hypothetical protein